MIGIIEEFGGEQRSFLLAVGQLRKVQEATGASPVTIARELSRCVNVLRSYPKATLFEQLQIGMGDWSPDFVRQPILQGLIGGGMAPAAATKEVASLIDDRGFIGLIENAPLALTLIVAGVSQPEDASTPGEPLAETAPPI